MRHAEGLHRQPSLLLPRPRTPPWWWHQYDPTSPTASVLGDGDRALRGIADCASGSITVHLLGKSRDMADSEAADLGCDLGRDANVHVIEKLNVAYGNIHQPI